MCFTFNITDDNCVEDKESFEVYLSSSDPYVDVHISPAIIIIWDNDCQFIHSSDKWYSLLDALFGIEYDTYFVAENYGPVTLCAELLEGYLEREVIIEYTTLDGTAQSRLCNSYHLSQFFEVRTISIP